MMNTRMRLQSAFQQMFAVFSLLALSPYALAQENASSANEITGVDYVVQQGGKVVVKVALKQALQTPPAGFTINNPPRIALDFMNTANQSGKNSLSINEGALRSVNVVQSGSRTRLVLNLSRTTTYETRMEGNNFIIAVQGGPASAVIANNTAQFAESKDANKGHSLRDVDFRTARDFFQIDRGFHFAGQIGIVELA